MTEYVVVIATYNAMPWIKKCLESCIGMNVIIVDNKSTDSTVNYVEENYPNVSILPQNQNFGFGQANNIGISYALKQGAEYVFLLNQDAYLVDGCIDVLIDMQQQNPQYGILSPIHLNGKGERLDQNFSNYVNYRNNPDFYSDFVLNKSLSQVYDLPFVNAAGWLLSWEILETVGGFDPIFFHYGEDDNYCQRARFHNFKIGVVPTAFLKHDREDREVIESKTSNYLANYERSLKMKYGDINNDNLGDLKHLLKKRKRALVKLLLKLRFSSVEALRKEIHITEKVIREVELSRDNNRAKGKHYLT
ncbi:glycosyltransferase family 2 protein [Aequorivita flava]|uniref:Glycosyltransferase family 2 protein n=1 Tax=Aequorivita flava TaxID=3114371 RepID=A0AB35YSY9_9FLAO